MQSKRAQKMLASTRYNADEYPAIVALVEFACRNPRLDARNYVTSHSQDRDGWRAYHSEARAITADLQRFALALQIASEEKVTDADVIAEGPHAFSGRLTWAPKQHTPATVAAGEAEREGDWNYCAGQYFPTEYRKAAATLLEYATRALRRSRPEQTAQVETIEDLKALNEANGGCWFERSTMAFFKSRIETGILPGSKFISSEKNGEQPRRYTVRTFNEKGDIGTQGDFQQYRTRRAAIKGASNCHETAQAA